MAIDGIFSTTINVLEKNLDLRVKNHNLISANIANAETPGYIPTTLSFEKELKTALNNRMDVTPSVTDPSEAARKLPEPSMPREFLVPSAPGPGKGGR